MKLSFVCLTLIAVTFAADVAHGAEGLIGNKLSARMRARSSLSANPRHQSHVGFITKNVKALFESKKKGAETEKAEVTNAIKAVTEKEKAEVKAADESAGTALQAPKPELKGSVEMGGISKNDLDSDEKKNQMKKRIAESLGVQEDQVQDVQVTEGRRRRLLAVSRSAKITYKVKGATETQVSNAEAKSKDPAFKEKMKKGAQEATGKQVTVKAVEAGPPPLPKNCGEVLSFIREHPEIPQNLKLRFTLASGKTGSSACDFKTTCRACVELSMTCGVMMDMMKKEMPAGHPTLPYAPGKTESTPCKMTETEQTCQQCFSIPGGPPRMEGPKNCGEAKKYLIQHIESDAQKNAIENAPFPAGITASTECSGETCSKCVPPEHRPSPPTNEAPAAPHTESPSKAPASSTQAPAAPHTASPSQSNQKPART